MIRSKCATMYNNHVPELEWTHLLDQGIMEEEGFDSLDFTRQKGAASRTLSQFDCIKQNCYFVSIVGVVCAHNMERVFLFSSVGEIWVFTFMILAGMDDSRKGPTAKVGTKQCEW